MKTVSLSQARRSFGALCASVVQERAPALIAPERAKPVVLIALSEWSAIQETLHLNGTSANTARLAQAITQLDAGQLEPD